MGFEDRRWEIINWIQMSRLQTWGQALATMIMNFCIP
jgi:hypothetical protein